MAPVARFAVALLLLAGVCSAQNATYKTALAALEGSGLTLFAKLAEVAGLRPYLNSTVTRATIFAPTDKAIKAFLAELKITKPEDALIPEYQMLIDRVVGYHVILESGDVAAAALTNGEDLTTSTNQTLTVYTDGGKMLAAAKPAAAAAPAATVLKAGAAKPATAAAPAAAANPVLKSGAARRLIEALAFLTGAPRRHLLAAAPAVIVKGAQNTATVTTADIKGGNVTIHVIDAVLLPPTVFTSIKAALDFGAKNFSTLASLVANDTALAKAAADPTTNVTMFAPTDKAFEAFLATPGAKALVADPKVVSKVLAYHAVKGARVVPAFKSGKPEVLPTLLAGQSVTVAKTIVTPAKGDTPAVGAVTVTADSAGAKPAIVKKHNIIAGASYINIIDGVLVPKL